MVESMEDSCGEGRERRKVGTRLPPREYPMTEKGSCGESQGRSEESKAWRICVL